MKVLLTATSMLATYGGPAYSVSRLAIALADAGSEVGLWAADDSLRACAPLVDKKSIKRISGSIFECAWEFDTPDVIHDNGIWLPHNHAIARYARARGLARIVSTRGMLEPWAIAHKRWKKRLAWWLYQRSDVMRAVRLHATSREERQNLEALKLGVPIVSIPNGVDVPPTSEIAAMRNSGGSSRSKVALFLGRIYPVKGLPMLIDAWAQVRPQGWVLRIAGPDEAGHRKTLERMVVERGLEEFVSFPGAVSGEQRTQFYAAGDLFILPSHSESFGMAIAEALAHGLPVVTTTGAPWPSLPERGCGWWVAPTVEAIADALRQATSADAATLRGMGERGRELVATEFGWSAVADAMITLYREAAGSRKAFATEG